jgi:hypothetical protein
MQTSVRYGVQVIKGNVARRLAASVQTGAAAFVGVQPLGSKHGPTEVGTPALCRLPLRRPQLRERHLAIFAFVFCPWHHR